MDLSKIPFFSMVSSKMAYLSERQAVLAQNVANADTPNYRAQDVSPPNFNDMVKHSTAPLAVQATQPGHISAARPSTAFIHFKRPMTFETTPTKNNVSIEEEMMQMSKTQMEYTQVASLYRKTLDLMRAALGRQGS